MSRNTTNFNKEEWQSKKKPTRS